MTSNFQRNKKPVMRRRYTPPTDYEVASCAFAIFAQEQPQRAMEIWLQAKAQLIAVRKHDAGLLRGPGDIVLTR